MLEYQIHAPLPTEFGSFELYIFRDSEDLSEVIALSALKRIKKKPLVRIHSSCATGDIFHSRKCDCGNQLSLAMQEISHEGGILIYLPQEGRGIGLINKVKAYAAQENHQLDTVDANLKLGFPIDARSYEQACEILHYFHCQDIVLLSNNPRKVDALTKAGFQVERRPLLTERTSENQNYLNTKAQKMGHLL